MRIHLRRFFSDSHWMSIRSILPLKSSLTLCYQTSLVELELLVIASSEPSLSWQLLSRRRRLVSGLWAVV